MRRIHKLFLGLTIPLVGFILYTVNQKVDSSAQLLSSNHRKHAHAELTDSLLAPADIKQLGITKLNDETESTSQEMWTSQMERTLNDPAVMESMDEQGVLNDLKGNPQKIKERLQRIEEEIAQQQIKARQHPTDSEEKSRLQALYMLKATLTALSREISDNVSSE